MIRGMHAMFYSSEAEALRMFIKEKLGLPATDVGEGWLIFPMEGEVGFHPGKEVVQDISLWCDDIKATVSELGSRGVEFTQDVEDHPDLLQGDANESVRPSLPRRQRALARRNRGHRRDHAIHRSPVLRGAPPGVAGL